MQASKMISAVKDNTRDYEQKLRAIERSLSEANEVELRLEHDIAGKLASIAALHLTHAPQPYQDALAVLSLRDDEERALRSRLATTEDLIGSLLQKVDGSKAQIRSTIKSVNDALSSNTSFAQLLEQHRVETERQRSTAANIDDLQAECERKLLPYRQHGLYRYLVDARFEQPDYQRRGLVRWLDNWVAGKCNYRANRANEQTLVAMQEELANTENASAQRIASLSGKLEAMKASEEERLGLIREKAELVRLQNAVQQEKQRANEIHKQLAAFADRRDPRYGQARNMVVAALQSQSPDELIARVKKTPGLEDDQLAQSVIAMQGQLKAHRAQVKELERVRRNAQTEYERAKALERKLRDGSYASSSYEYKSGLDLDSLLVGYMAGRLSEDAAVREVRQYRREVEEESYSSRSNSTWSSSSSSSSSGSDYSTSNSSGGGDYSTSDSF